MHSRGCRRNDRFWGNQVRREPLDKLDRLGKTYKRAKQEF